MIPNAWCWMTNAIWNSLNLLRILLRQWAALMLAVGLHPFPKWNKLSGKTLFHLIFKFAHEMHLILVKGFFQFWAHWIDNFMELKVKIVFLIDLHECFGVFPLDKVLYIVSPDQLKKSFIKLRISGNKNHELVPSAFLYSTAFLPLNINGSLGNIAGKMFNEFIECMCYLNSVSRQGHLYFTLCLGTVEKLTVLCRHWRFHF